MYTIVKSYAVLERVVGKLLMRWLGRTDADMTARQEGRSAICETIS